MFNLQDINYIQACVCVCVSVPTYACICMCVYISESLVVEDSRPIFLLLMEVLLPLMCEPKLGLIFEDFFAIGDKPPDSTYPFFARANA